MPRSTYIFRNVILCDDVRDEVSGKKSLMGVLSGDILTDEMPATIQTAFYMEYIPEERSEGEHQLRLRLLIDDKQIMSARTHVQTTGMKVISLILPKALVRFEKNATLRLIAEREGEEGEQELLKRVVSKKMD